MKIMRIVGIVYVSALSEYKDDVVELLKVMGYWKE